MAGGFESLHAPLALTRLTMRILTPIIQIATLAVFDARENLALGRAIALQFFSHDHPRHVCQALEELAEELLGGVLVPSTLHQNIEDVIVLIDGREGLQGTRNCRPGRQARYSEGGSSKAPRQMVPTCGDR